jgi:myo-inositol-1(or 4)-monophosphatase
MNDKQFWQDVLNFAKEITDRIGSKLIKDVGKLEANCKEDGSLVTAADKWADAEIRDAIATTFPEHGILTEETEHILPDRDWCWVVDPIDGTTNFTRGVPLWGISLGLLYKGTPVFGLVSIPPLNHTFYGYWLADSGLIGPTGAYLNDEPIYTSRDSPSHSHLFNLCARSIEILKNPFPCKIRMIGVASYNILLVASGAALGGVEATPKIWDIAAVYAILQAAGGVFVSLESKPVFPLKIGQDYSDRSFPCLAVSQAELVPIFKPLVEFIGKKKVIEPQNE